MREVDNLASSEYSQLRILSRVARRLSSLAKREVRMSSETQQSEYPYSVKIETPTGRSTTVALAFLTTKQLEAFLQTEFKRLAQEAGVKGARIHVERAIAADYQEVIHEVTACLRSGH
jgi:hypothetical protein